MSRDSQLKERHNRERRFAKWLPVIFLVLVPAFIGVLVLTRRTTDRERENLLSQLTDMGGDVRVFVANREARDPQAIIGVLKTVADVRDHHLSLDPALPVEIRAGNRTLRLKVAYDSRVPGECWVFVQADGAVGQSELGVEVGRVNTLLFAEAAATPLQGVK